MLKVTLPRPHSTVWISPEISYVNSLENGKVSLKLSVTLRLLMVIFLEFSQLPSQRELPRIVRRLLMLKPHKLKLLEKKLLISLVRKLPNVTLTN